MATPASIRKNLQMNNCVQIQLFQVLKHQWEQKIGMTTKKKQFTSNFCDFRLIEKTEKGNMYKSIK